MLKFIVRMIVARLVARFLWRALLVLLPIAGAGVGWISKSMAQNPPPASAMSTQGQPVYVERVLDGDTVQVRGIQTRIRLASIDAPEMSHGYGRPGQPYSVAASRWLENELQGKPGVTMRCVDRDGYDRDVCNFYRDGRFVNKEMVRAGMSWANTANPRYLRDQDILAEQQHARAQRRGLWAGPGTPIEPWRWRRDCWQQKQCAFEE